MSSARRYQEDIRRIVGLQDETRGLDDDLPRMRIGGERGIWQIGNNELKTGSAGGEDEDGNEEEPVTPDEDANNQNEDGSGTGGQNTDPDGTGAGDGSDGSGDSGTEVIDPDEPNESGQNVDSDTFGSDWASGGPIGFVDCETNKCIELVPTGGYVPPDGWDDADTGPIDPTWDASKYWSTTGSSPYGSHKTVSGMCSRIAQDFPRREGSGQTSGIKYFNGCGSLVFIGDSVMGIKVYNLTYTTKYVYDDGKPDVFQDITISVSHIPCGSSTTGVCDGNPPPLPEYWPSDNCIQLAPNSEGNWQASSRESPDDMTAKYSEAKSILNVCNSSGEPIDIYQRVGGGHVFFNQTQGIWAGSDSSGRIRSFGSSSTLDQEIARPRN